MVVWWPSRVWVSVSALPERSNTRSTLSLQAVSSFSLSCKKRCTEEGRVRQCKTESWNSLCLPPSSSSFYLWEVYCPDNVLVAVSLHLISCDSIPNLTEREKENERTSNFFCLPWRLCSSNYLSTAFEGQTGETFAQTKPAPTLLPYPTPQKQLNPLTGRSTIRSQALPARKRKI